MKKIYKVIICMLCCSGGLWLLKTHFDAKSTPEVIKIYKAVPIDSLIDSSTTHATQIEHVEIPRVSTGAETEDSDTPQTDARLFAETELTPEEEISFLEWLESLEETPSTNASRMELETEDSKDIEERVQQLTTREEIQIIDELFPLEEIVEAYGGDPRGNGVQCPSVIIPTIFTLQETDILGGVIRVQMTVPTTLLSLLREKKV